MDLVLRERGNPVAVSPADWQNLQLDETVGVLARNGILKVERTSAAILLMPSHYVGEMRAPGITLTVLPKDRDLYAAMVSLAVRFHGRQTDDFDAGVLGKDGNDYATPYLQALHRCVEEGLPWRYEQQTEATSRPRGKLHFGKTLSAFVSRGVTHKVVSVRHERHQIAHFANVVWAAYRLLPGAPGATPSLLRNAAILIEAFEAPGHELATDVIAEAERLLARNEPPSASSRDLIDASLNLLDRENRAGRFAIPLPSGTARFTDLEHVWERAVAMLIDDTVSAVGSAATIHGLSANGIRLFGKAGPVINPDVVVRDTDGVITMLADAKYKILAGKEPGGIASDVYQLTCYVDRSKAKDGFLVYFGAADSLVILGNSQTGARIATIRLSANSLISHGHSALSRLLTEQNFLIENV